MVEMVGQQWLRERFVATCLQGRQFWAYKALFEHVPTLSLAEWRWGSLWHVICHIVARMVPLRLAFDPSRMAFEQGAVDGAGNQNDRAHPVNCTLEKCNRIYTTISSEWFWAYSHMLYQVGSFVKDFELYCYSCNCHPERTAHLIAKSDVLDRSRLAVLLAQERCPMMGRIACNFAAGTWKQELQRFAEVRAQSMLQHSCNLTVADRAELIRDFERAKSKLIMTLQVSFHETCMQRLQRHSLTVICCQVAIHVVSCIPPPFTFQDQISVPRARVSVALCGTAWPVWFRTRRMQQCTCH